MSVENAKLLKTLIEIDHGKSLSVSKHDIRHSPIKSLNIVKWKKDSRAIDTENNRLKNAIINVKSGIPCKQKPKFNFYN